MPLSHDYVVSKSKARLAGLHPIVKAAISAVIDHAYREGIYIVAVQGLRTITEQNALYAQGRTAPGPKVTNAKGGQSFHNFGLAVDVAQLTLDGHILWSVDDHFKRVVDIAKSYGFEWGGDWETFKDNPHFQMSFGLDLGEWQKGAKPTQEKLDAVKHKIQALGVEEEVQKVNFVVNGKNVDGFMKDDKTYFPAGTLRDLGFNVEYKSADKPIIITTPKKG